MTTDRFAGALRDISGAGGCSAGPEEACDGTQALCMIEQLSPDVVLLDVGNAKAGWLRGAGKGGGQKRRAGVIMISALVQEAFVLRAVELGATFFLQKPFDAIGAQQGAGLHSVKGGGRHIEPRSRTVVRMGEKERG